jgi:hypothetical protein
MANDRLPVGQGDSDEPFAASEPQLAGGQYPGGRPRPFPAPQTCDR